MPSYNLPGTEGKEMQGRRDVRSTLGYGTAIDILPGSDGVRLVRSDAPAADPVVLDRRGAEILSAYLASVIAIGVRGRAPEEVEDETGTVLSAHDEPAPIVRIAQQGRTMDVPSITWDALRCEINLVLPRLKAERQTGTRH